MVDFPLAVSPPQGVSYAAPLLNFTPLSQLADKYAQGVKTRSELDTIDTLKQGLPTTADGQIDYAKAAQMLAQTGNIDAVSTIAQIGALSQRARPGTTPQLTDVYDETTGQPRKAIVIPATGETRFLGGAKRPDETKTIPNEVEERRKAVIAQGGNTKDPAMRAYILTGRLPREDQQPLTATDKKAILEADEGVLAAETAITFLRQAKKLSPTANQGFGASARAKVANNLPDWMVPDAISSPESAAATSDYDNLVLGQALSQLKSIFGAAPTEGERKILLDLQASSSLPDKVRQGILDRAVILAEKRLAFNRQRAQELRGGSFYRGKGPEASSPTKSTAPAGSPDPLAEARAAIAKGAPRDKVIERLKANGIDPTGL